MPYQAGIEGGEGRSRHVTFDTTLGYEYRLYSSEDLATWTPIEPPFYGFGVEYSVHVLTVPEPGESPGDPLPAPPHFHPLLTDLGDGDTLVSFSGDDGNPYQTLLAGLAFLDADPIGAYFDPVSGIQFTWMRNAGPHLAGYDSLPPLPAGEQVKVDAFAAAHDEIDQPGSASPGGAVTQYLLGEVRFWRVQQNEIDADRDGLMDWLEFALGLSAFNEDSDFNGVADGDEDSDGDGAVNWAEVYKGTDAGDPSSVPVPEIYFQYRSRVFTHWTSADSDCYDEDGFFDESKTFTGEVVSFNSSSASVSYFQEEFSCEEYGDPEDQLFVALSSAEESFDSNRVLTTIMPATVFASQEAGWYGNEDPFLDPYESNALFDGFPSYYSEIYEVPMVDVQWKEVRLEADIPVPNEVTRAFLIVTEIANETGWEFESVEVAELTIAQGETKANQPIELTPIGVDGEARQKSLLTVEILVPGIVADGTETGQLVQANELKVAKMEQSLDANGVLDIDADPDRFYIRIKGAQSLGPISINLGTTGNPDTAYNDNATEITLGMDPNGGALRSPSLLLVSDITDDKHDGNGGIEDDQPNDRTHLVQLGGNVSISAITIAGTTHMTGLITPVKVKKTVTVKLINCVYGFPLFKGPCWPAAEVTLTKKTLKERYAQVGLKIEVTEVPGPDIGITGVIGDYPTISDPPPPSVQSIPQDTINIIQAGPTAAPEEVLLYLVRKLDVGGDTTAGASIVEKYMTPAHKSAGYANKSFVGQQDKNRFTASHEVLHLLLNGAHWDYQTEFDASKMLWHATHYTGSIDDTKRISALQETKILSSSLAK